MRVKELKCNLSEDMPCTLLVVGEIIGSKQFTIFADIGAGKLWSTRNKPLPVQLNLQFDIVLPANRNFSQLHCLEIALTPAEGGTPI